jgi:ribose transport system substrate-binding protein
MKPDIFSCSRGLLLFTLSAGLTLAAPVKIGLLVKGRTAFWDLVSKGGNEAAQAAGAELIAKAPMSESDITGQLQLLNVLVAQGVQAIVIAPNNKDNLAAPVEAAAAKGIKIIVIDSPLSGTAATVFVGTDQHGAGAAAGELLIKLIKAGDEVSILKHTQTGGATMEREQGAAAKLREAFPNLVLHGDIYASSEPYTEPQKAELLLTKYPATKAVLASGTPGTMAMLRLIDTRKLAGKIQFVGFGYNLNPEVAKGIELGTIQGWIAQLPKEVGRKGVETAIAVLQGKSVPAVVHTDYIVITKDNLNDPKVQALLAP